MSVGFEWDVETVDENDDIVDHDFRDSYAECMAIAAAEPPEGCRFAIVLVRNSDHAFDGRAWAYLDGGKLPTHFEDAYQHPVAKVPAKFHREVERAKEPA